MNTILKDRYKKLVHFLGRVLGENYEVVLHDISDDGSSVIAIENSHISGRSVNSPLTGFALELIQNKKYLESDYLINYKAKTKQNLKINGSTFFIKDGDKIEGMLCINYDGTKFEKLSNEILRLGNLASLDAKQDAIEQLSQSVEEIIVDTLERYNLNIENLKPKDRAKCIKMLYKSGIFNIKGAIPKVAKYLNISEPSVYRYLQKNQKSKL
ncbi:MULTISPECIES: transcriptional regulator [Campylobacter]|uniref:helix-turn-helix transcriptional regulator n=1 Tax=Campylobacter TaxID=194 RepID=UPI00146FFDE6|nr:MULTISPECIES: PAS domain-containing protein [Campylobacter]MBN7287317.1 PAS domain-containing protein [Campylobacter curvus]MDU6826771.1 PAS domain-containing protein [Campylobacter sp.]